ncbi:MAG: Na+/H+ antiporter subunit G [Deltaproteobacteria bacterium]|nr:Na+/H+ antiporter subunit G [Deltaproteobacteria bacterium]
MPTSLELLVTVMMVLGTFLTVVACVGLLRFPDVYCRLHAAGKAGTLGVSLLILAPMLYFVSSEAWVFVRGAFGIYFQFLTTPAATHILARASYVSDYALHERTAVDDLRAFLPSRPHETYGRE